MLAPQRHDEITETMDGSVSTLAPIFATAFATQSTWTTFLVGLSASVGAGISMGFTEAAHDKLLGDLAAAEAGHQVTANRLAEHHLGNDERGVEDAASRRQFILTWVQPGLAGLMMQRPRRRWAPKPAADECTAYSAIRRSNRCLLASLHSLVRENVASGICRSKKSWRLRSRQEEEDGRIYAAYAARLRAEYPATAAVFSGMAAEEDEHRRKLIELYQQTASCPAGDHPGNGDWPQA